MPVLALPVMMGGVSGAQVGALCLVLLASCIFSLSAGVAISSRGLSERTVLVQTLVFLILIAVAPRLIGELVLGGTFHPFHVVRLISPLDAFVEANRGWTPRLTVGLIVLVVSAVVLVLYAGWRLKANYAKHELSPVDTASAATRGWERRAPRQWLLWQNPMLWLVLRSGTPESRVLVFAASFVIFGALCRAALEFGWRQFVPLVLFGSYGCHLLFKFLLTAEACRQLNSDRRSGALELLLATPLPPSLISGAIVKGARRTWWPASLGLVILNCTWMTEHDFLRELGILLPSSLLLLAFDIHALAWSSVARAVKGERYTRTVVRSFAEVIVPPLVVIVVLMVPMIGSAVSRETVLKMVVFWSIGCVLYDLFLVRNARLRLLHFRLLAAGDSPRSDEDSRWSAHTTGLAPIGGSAGA
jgi:hypothetical protein